MTNPINTTLGEVMGMTPTEASQKDNFQRAKNGHDPTLKASPHLGLFEGVTLDKSLKLRPASRDDTAIPDRLQRYHDYYGVPLEPYEMRLAKAKVDVRRAFQLETIRDDETLPYRIRVAWRITRALGSVTGVMDDDEPLTTALVTTRDDPDPWTTTRPPPMIDTTTFYGSQLQVLELYLERADELFDGIGLLPPENCPKSLVLIWTSMVETIASALGMEKGSEALPELGRLGLIPLVDPETTQDQWPTRLQIIVWEHQLIEETADLLGKMSPPKVKAELFRQHGLTTYEGGCLVKMAIRAIREEFDLDIEDHRALMIARLNDYIERSRTALNLRSELSGLKQISIVLGLSRVDPEDIQTEFIKTVRLLDQQDDRQAKQIEMQ